MISSVPSSRWEIASERISSSVTTPPALRITWASPSCRPSAPEDVEPGVHAGDDSDLLAGGSGRSALVEGCGVGGEQGVGPTSVPRDRVGAMLRSSEIPGGETDSSDEVSVGFLAASTVTVMPAPAGHSSCCGSSARFLAAGYGVLFTLLDDMRDEYGIGESALGAVIGIGFVAGFVAQVTIAPLADRGHARTLVIIGTLLNVAGLLVMAASTTVRAVARRAVRDGSRRRDGRPGDPPDRDHRRSRQPRPQPRTAARRRRGRVRRRAGAVGRAGRPVRHPRAVHRHRRGHAAADPVRAAHHRARVQPNPRSNGSPSICCANGPTPARSPSAVRCG